MKRCFFITCDGEKQGYIISKEWIDDDFYCKVIDLNGNTHILNNWKVVEVRF